MDTATQLTEGRESGSAPRDGAPVAAELPHDRASALQRGGSDLAWLLARRDFAFNARRYLISLIAAGLVMGIALLLSGIKSGLENEITRTIDSFHANTFLVARGSRGPFTSPISFPVSRVGEVRSLPGVTRADPVLLAPVTTTTPRLRNVHVVGVVPGGLGSPAGSAALLSAGEAVPDASLGLHPGDTLRLNGVPFRVGAITHGKTYFAGIPSIALSLANAQRLVFGGREVATMVATQGRPRASPHSFTIVNRPQVKKDLELPVAQATKTIVLIRTLLWLFTAGIIGAVIYLAVQERIGEFAVFKAVGISTRTLTISLALQAVALAVGGAVLAVGFELLMAPQSGTSVEVSGGSYVTLFVLACLVGVVASLLALRRAVSVDPSTAFGA
jgi:putative ABC transport system permease protein